MSTKTQEQIKEDLEKVLELRARFKPMFDSFEQACAQSEGVMEAYGQLSGVYSKELEDMYVNSVLDGVSSAVSPQDLEDWIKNRNIESDIQKIIVKCAKDLTEYLMKDVTGTVQ